MRLAYSDHAIDQMRARDIGFSLVEDAVRRAEVTFDDKDRYGRPSGLRVVHQTATIRVAVDWAFQPPEVVTVAWRHEGPGWDDFALGEG